MPEYEAQNPIYITLMWLKFDRQNTRYKIQYKYSGTQEKQTILDRIKPTLNFAQPTRAFESNLSNMSHLKFYSLIF